MIIDCKPNKKWLQSTHITVDLSNQMLKVAKRRQQTLGLLWDCIPKNMPQMLEKTWISVGWLGIKHMDPKCQPVKILGCLPPSSIIYVWQGYGSRMWDPGAANFGPSLVANHPGLGYSILIRSAWNWRIVRWCIAFGMWLPKFRLGRDHLIGTLPKITANLSLTHISPLKWNPSCSQWGGSVVMGVT